MREIIAERWIVRIIGIKKLLISAAFAIFVFGLLTILQFNPTNRIIVSWDAFCLPMIILSWILFSTTKQNELCDIVESQDENLETIFAIVIVAIVLSIVGALTLMTEKNDTSDNKILHTLILLSPILLSWVLLNTIFTIHYARLYHYSKKLAKGDKVGGVDFPGEQEPDYIDFAYFSFVIGMTFQVSDVTISSKVIRRYVLMHSIISFIFNTIIIALTINALAGLRQ